MKISEICKIYNLLDNPSFSAVLNPDVLKMEEEIFIVVLTGGPCAGKTTTLNKALRQSIAIPNCEVYIAQEAANHLKNGNVNFVSAGGDSTFQRLIIEHQLTAEESVIVSAIKHKIAHPEDRVLCIFDRSIMDGQAYFDDVNDFIEILKDYNLTPEEVYKRSDEVLYLRSAAIGAEHAYTTSDGTKRDESVEDAAKLDRNVYEAWKGHKNLIEVDNSFRFNEKLDFAISKIFEVAGIIIPVKVCRRFIIHTPNAFLLHSYTTHLETFWDKSIFMKMDPSKPNFYKSVRIRTGDTAVSYHLSEQRWEKVKNPKTKRMTEEAVYDTVNQISQDDVIKSILDMDPHINSVEKMVNTFFICNDIYCELAVYECNQQYGYLRVFFDCADDQIPDYINTINTIFEVLREVTFERKYCEYEIARTNGTILSKADS